MADRAVSRAKSLFHLYCICCTATNKSYIGITSLTAQARFRRHFVMANRGARGHLYNAMRLYGKENFEFVSILTVTTWTEACAKEQEFIAVCKTKVPYGYNLTDGGEGNVGFEYTEEQKLKFVLRGKANKGRKLSDETRAKMSQAHAGRIPEAAIAVNLGSKRTSEQRARMSAAMTGLKRSEEGKKNISLAAKLRNERAAAVGRPYKPPSPLGRTQSKETRRKIGEARKAAWAAKKAAVDETENLV